MRPVVSQKVFFVFTQTFPLSTNSVNISAIFLNLNFFQLILWTP